MAARAAHAAGLCVVPIKPDGSKRPDLGSWKFYQEHRPSSADVDRWFSVNRSGLGIICGAVSGGLELFDFDDAATYSAFVEVGCAVGLGSLIDRIEAGYCEGTPKPGVHWFYRCPEPSCSKLAKADRATTLIETKGEGGFAVVAPSYGPTHPTGKPYVLRSGGFDSIASVSAEERRQLFDLARTFDRMEGPRQPQNGGRAPGSDGNRPGDDFNRRTTWPDVLEPLGWTLLFESNGVAYWRRRGKTEGWSATTNHGGTDRLKVFSSSTEFESVLEGPSGRGQTYDRFGAYALLHHAGDLALAARELAAKGYGDQCTRTGPVEARHEAIQSAPGFSARQDGGGTSEPECASPVSDVANAFRIAKGFREELRWSPGLGWIVWTGKCWTRDEAGALGLASRLGRIVLQEAAQVSAGAAEADSEKHRATLTRQAEALTKWARESEKESRIRAALNLVRPHLRIDEAELDAHSLLLNVENGTIDLETGALRPHRQDDYLTRLAPVEYDLRAKAPRWQAFLERILPGGELREFVQSAVGYSLTGLTGEQILLLLWGSGANRKSTFVETILALLGDYALRTPPDTLLAKRTDGIPNDVARLRGARFVSAVETDEGRRLSESRVKELTGGDTISARFMRAEFFDFRPVCKLWLATNHRPQVRGTDEAIWRRIRLVPFTETIPPEGRDRELPSRLRQELPGILAWAVRGCLEWQRPGLRPPPAVQVATEEYRAAEDVIGTFLDERCETGPPASVWAPAAELYAAFIEWARSAGEEQLSQKRFGAALRERGLVSERRGKTRTRIWRGVRPLAAEDQDRRADG
ncbi:MAG: phage/plasmid primase, P4 family [Myxococcota bacterium]